MAQIGEVLDNVFAEPESRQNTNPKEKVVPNYRKKFQLLSYDNVTKLSDVMETTVPVHGKGNFPALEVTPSRLVQMVREGLAREGIRVPNVRLNGSAATHVLSENKNHTYKDLDLIFAVDLSEYSDAPFCHMPDLNNNIYRRKNTGNKSSANRKHVTSYPRVSPISNEGTRDRRLPHTAPSTPYARSRNPSPTHERPSDLSINAEDDNLDAEINRACASKPANLSPCPTSPRTILGKRVDGVDYSVEDGDLDSVDKDSGYTSSGSSVSSLPVSPAGCWVYQPPTRSRTHSLDSSSSIASSSSCSVTRGDTQIPRHRDTTTPTGNYLDVHTTPHQYSGHRQTVRHSGQEFCSSSKDDCWQKIKDVVIAILRELLPVRVSLTRMTDAVLTDAYVQKMVKINNEMDRWSLISLNNNTGRNLELKFVENMRRQYEFSVDSFQIILDSYQRFKIVSKRVEENVKLSPYFYPSVLVESVYGDFAAALRHLRHRRICTHRPEEIRGGGLLRYCNLLVRDYIPGEVPGCKTVEPCDLDDSLPPTPKDEEISYSLPLSFTPHLSELSSLSYSSSRAEDVSRFEQLMCSRFFIDFSEFPRQQQKLLSYLESHFAGEDELKFQYLLILRRVVDKSTVCLMTDERCMIIEFITKMARETLAINVGTTPKTNSTVTNQPHAYRTSMDRGSPCYQVYQNHTLIQNPYYQPPPTNTFQYQAPEAMYPNPNSNNNNNVTNAYYSHFSPPTVKQNYAPICYPQSNTAPVFNHPSYPCSPSEPHFYSPFPGYPVSPVPMMCCPCCHAVYPPNPAPYSNHEPQFKTNPSRHGMSPNSAPFYPLSKTIPPPPTAPNMCEGQINSVPQGPKSNLVFLPENAKLYYSLTPATQNSVTHEDRVETPKSADTECNGEPRTEQPATDVTSDASV